MRPFKAVAAALAAIALAVGGAVAVAGPASALVTPVGAAPGFSVTYVARVCDEYTDVMANKARNNIMESLRDLGPDSTYPLNGIVDPVAEAAGSPNCRPLTNWTFSTGTGLTGKTPASHYLSTVTGPYATPPITTAASTALLDSAGNDTGAVIEGAVTVPLTAAQLTDVQAGRRIVVQGGVGNDTLNGLQTTFGFAALRCAADALNGDNVDYVSFPNGARHVFCYYYAVSPPPDPGTITIRKQVVGDFGTGVFTYEGTLSYNHTGDEEGRFTLSATAGGAIASQTFVRGAVGPDDPPWTVEELAQTGWQLDAPPSCTSSNLSTSYTVDGAKLSIRLGADDSVVCTYVNRRGPIGQAGLYKETQGGVGTFPFDISPPGRDPYTASATTTQPGEPVLVTQSTAVESGTFSASEQLPAPTDAGHWAAPTAACGDTPLTPTDDGGGRWTASVDIDADEDVNCLVVNSFVPEASLSLRKITQGGVGTFPFEVYPVEDDDTPIPAGEIFTTSATTTAEGVAVDADDALEGIDVFANTRFAVSESLPAASDAGTWRMVSAECGDNPVEVDTTAALAVVTLSEALARPVCTFTNEFVPVGTLTVTKNTSADPDERSGDVVMRLNCGVGVLDFSLAPGTDSATISPYNVYDDDTCTLEELASGVAPGYVVTITATITVDGGPPQPFDQLGAFDVAPGEDVVIVVDNAFSAVPPEPPEPPGPPAPPTLPATGVDWPVGWVGLGALIALAAGAGALLLSRRRGSH